MSLHYTQTRITTLILTIFALALISSPAHAAGLTINVPGDYASIQQAINAASSGDTIVVAPGAHKGNVVLGKKSIHLRSSDGPAVTTIKAQGSDSVMTISSTGSLLTIEGFTFTGGNASHGGGMRIDGSHVDVTDCVFENNSSSNHGGAIYITGDHVSITNCDFENNTTLKHGGGIYSNASNVTVTNSAFKNNGAQVGGAIYSVQSSNINIFDSLFCENTPDDIFGPWSDLEGNVFVYGCPVLHVPEDFSTIQQAIDAAFDGDFIMVAPGNYSEKMTIDKEIHLLSSGGPDVTTINLWGSIGRVITIPLSGAGSTVEGFTITGGFTGTGEGGGVRIYGDNVTVTNCVVKTNTGGGMRIDGNNVTVSNSRIEDNYTVNGGGLIIRGDDVTVDNCSIEHNSAHFGGGMLIRGTNVAVTNCLIANNWTNGGGGGGIFIWDDSSATFAKCVFEKNSGGAILHWAPSTVTLGDSLFCENSPHDLSGSGSIIDLGGNEFFSDCPKPTLHVPSDYVTIQQAIDAADDGYAIIVAPGTYNENVTVNKALDLIGSGGPDVTRIDAQGSGRVIAVPLSGAGSTIEGFTITRGNAGIGAGMNVIDGNTVSVINCVFEYNSANLWGGGMSTNFNSTVTVTDCIFRSNSADVQGGGMFIGATSTASISNSLFCDNTPDDIDGPIDDLGGNVFFEECPPECVPADLNCDGVVDVFDLIELINNWGPCVDPKGSCPADLNDDGVVDVFDLIELINNWG